MSPPDKRQPRPGSSPELTGIVTPDQPERGAVRHAGVDGAPQVLPPHRRGTLPGGIAALPVPPPLPGELAPTIKAPARPLLKQTWRVPTPPSTVAMARRSDRPPTPESSVSPGPSSGRAGDRETILEAELAKSRAEVARLERDARAAAEARQVTYPPKVEQRSQTPVPSSAPTKSDAALGAGVRHLLGKFAPFLLAAAGIGGGVTAVAKPSADPEKADATLASVEELGRKLDRVDTKVNGLLDREPQLTEFVECLYEQQADYFEQLLPSQQRLVTGSLQRTWVDRCRNRRPKR